MAAFSLIETTCLLGLAATLGEGTDRIRMAARSVLCHNTATKFRGSRRQRLAEHRQWWAHFKSTRINIQLTISKNQVEELMNVRGVGEKSFLKLKAQLTVNTPKAEPAKQ